jgi:uncharacterized protein YlxW (UPF0749 family)
MTATPANRMTRIVAPSQVGLGFGFFLGGDWYRRRLDFDLGTGSYHSRMQADPPRVGVALAAALLGFLAVLAARQPPRASRELRRLELADLIQAEDGRVRGLREEIRHLQTQLDAVGASGSEVAELRHDVRELSLRAGPTGVEGSGVLVTLDDSSAERSPTGDPNDLIVHERDIQTVVNALWAAGAEAVSVDGERLTATSAVRCAGNTLLLHGALHSPPYRIGAIGDPDELARSVTAQPGMGRLLDAARAFGLRLDIEQGQVRVGEGPPPRSFAVAGPSGGT